VLSSTSPATLTSAPTSLSGKYSKYDKYDKYGRSGSNSGKR
jgi:hypothetical protein